MEVAPGGTHDHDALRVIHATDDGGSGSASPPAIRTGSAGRSDRLAEDGERAAWGSNGNRGRGTAATGYRVVQTTRRTRATAGATIASMIDRPAGRGHERGWARLAAAFGGLLLAIAACGPGPTAAPSSPSPSATETPGQSATAGPSDTARPTPTAASARAYFVLGFGTQAGLVPVVGRLAPTEAGPEAGVRALLAGPAAVGPPDVDESVLQMIQTAIPPGVGLLALTVDAGVATVDLDATFESVTDDGLPTAFRVAQVVYTLTQFPEVAGVLIRIEGALVTVIGPDAFAQDRPLTRADFTDQLPALFVDEPAWGATISSPVRVAGLANAFEATFELRIADAEGRALAAGTVTATCGTGCWGEFEVLVPFTVRAAEPGVLQVYELSPRDGARQNLRQYPVTLVP
jgi:spore germination protein GerM